VRKTITALAASALIGAGVAGAAPAGASAAGYVLNNSSAAIFVRGSDGISHQVRPGSSSAAYMADADSIHVERGKVLRTRVGIYFGPQTIKVPDGAVYTVYSYQNRR
jgi:hypothetical protein